MVSLTLEEIAHKAGVSRSTVSRVINNQPNVRDEVRKRVLQVVKETGYLPNTAARSLASQRTNVIGLVIPRTIKRFFTDPYFPRLTQGIAEACNRYDYTLSLFLFHTEDEEHKLFPRIARRGFVDGVIIQATYAGQELFEQLIKGEVPYVVAGRPLNDPISSYVDVDNVSAAYIATSHLVHRGYTRIAHISGPLVTSAGIDRFEGYKQALAESDLPFLPSLFAEGDFTEISGYYAAQRILSNKPDAIFIAADLMAVGAMRAIREANYQIPDDIAIVSFDDLPPAAQVVPRLSTVRQPIRRMGIKLVETLVDILENGPTPPRRILFGTELMVRESCGAMKIKESA